MKKVLLIVAAVCAVLAIAFRVALPYITAEALIYGVEANTPYKAEVGDVRYDIWNGKAALTDVKLRLENVVELGVKDFNFDLIWPPIFSGKVHVDKVQLAGVTTRVLMDKERLEVAGYDLNAPADKDAKDTKDAEAQGAAAQKAEEQKEKEQEKGDGTLPVVVNGINIANTEVAFTGENGKKAKFVIEALKVSAIDLSRKDQAAGIDAKLKIDKSPIVITGDVYPLDLANTSAVKLKMTKVNLGNLAALVKSKLPPGMAIAGLLTTDLATTFAMAEPAQTAADPAKASAEPATINLSAKGTIGLAGLDFAQPDMAASLASLGLVLDNKVTLKGDKYQVSGPAKLNVKQLVFAGKDGLKAAIGSIAVAQKLAVATDRIKADGTIKIDGVDTTSPPTRAQVGAIALTTAAVMQGDAPSGTVSGTITDIVTIDLPKPEPEKPEKPESKKPKPAKSGAKGKKGQKAEKAAKPTSPEPTLQAKTLTLDKVKLATLEPLKVTAGQIKLSDFVLAYPYENKGIDYDPSVLDLTQLNLTLDKFNDPKGQKGLIDFSTKIGQTGTIKVNGTSKTPAPNKTTLKLKATVDAFDLSDFSGFFMQQMGYRIERGSLNADVKVAKDTKDNLKGNAKILLAKLDVSDKDRRGKTIKNRSSVPLESSLSMTKDDSDNLPLEFPITGNLNSPSFSPRILLTEKLSDILVDQLTQSLGTAIVSNYLPMLASSAALSPVLVYSLLKKGVDVATKLRFEPITFGVNSAIPTPKGMKTIRTVQKNLGSRPNLILKFCTKAYYGETKDSVKAKQKLPAKLDEAKIKGAFALAQKRLTYVRKTLRRAKKVKAKQIVTCKPSLESKVTTAPELTIAI